MGTLGEVFIITDDMWFACEFPERRVEYDRTRVHKPHEGCRACVIAIRGMVARGELEPEVLADYEEG